MKKLLSIALALILCLTISSAAFCEEDDTVVCYSFGIMSGGPAWGQYQNGFYAACEELGWEGHYLCPTTDNNMAELFNLHDTAISNGADVMIPCVTDNEAMSDILQRAVDAGIVMVGIPTAPHAEGNPLECRHSWSVAPTIHFLQVDPSMDRAASGNQFVSYPTKAHRR